ncbi:MAG: metallophosphoesterase [Armatimonadota bacterium]|jgi:Icc-related predicted phosphoesterase
MKALVFSDVHGKMDAVRHLMRLAPRMDCDLGLFCGDVVRGSARGSEFLAAKEEGREADLCKPEVAKERAEDYALYAEFYGCLRPSPFPIYGVPGNMDAPEGRYLTCSLTEEGGNSPMEVVHRSLARHGDYVISGLGGQITEVDRHEFLVLQYPRWEALHQLRLLEFVDAPRIMVLHTPPIGEVVDRDNGGHKGSQVVNELINTFRPKLAVCGHAHDAQGQETIAQTLVVNPGSLKDGRYAIVDLEEMEAELLQL